LGRVSLVVVRGARMLGSNVRSAAAEALKKIRGEEAGK
jgi:hypothetical protein